MVYLKLILMLLVQYILMNSYKLKKTWGNFLLIFVTSYIYGYIVSDWLNK